MAKNYFADAEMSQAPTSAPSPESEPAPEMEEETASESPTAELPSSVLGGQEFKPGDTVTLEVVKTMGDSVLVRYFTPPEEEAPSSAAESAPEPGAGGAGAYME